MEDTKSKKSGGKTPVRFYLNDQELEEVDRVLEEHAAKRATFAKKAFLERIRAK